MPSPHTDDEQSSDEEASLTAPAADAPTTSTYYGDVFESSSSSEGSRSDGSRSDGSSNDGSSSDELSGNDSPCPETSGSHDNPTHIEDDIRNSEATMVSEEEYASNLVVNPSFHMQGDDVPYGSTTDNSDDDAVPDNSEAVPDMQMYENTRTSSAQVSETSHIEDNLHSDEDAPLTAPTADAPTASTYNGDIIDSSRSREGSSSDGSSSDGSSSDDSSSDESSDNDSPCPERTSGLDDNPTHRPPIVPQVEVDASNLVVNPSFHMQGVPINGDMVDPSSSSFIGDDFHDGYTTDNSEDVAVPHMQMHENTRTNSTQISDISNIEVHLHSDEDASLTAPTADAPTASVCYGDLFDSSSSSEGQSGGDSSNDGSCSDKSSDNDSPCPDDMVVPSSSSFMGDDFHDVSTTDNFVDVDVDVAVPDNNEAVAVPDNSEAVAVPDNSEVVAVAVPGIQMHESPQTSSAETSNPSNFKVNLQPTRRRRTAPAYFNDPESIGARLAKRKRDSTAPIELATPLDVTNYTQEVSARLANERVSRQDFQQFYKTSIRSLQKYIASSKRALREAPK
ncbi:papilin-like [Drosophila madeirensis]|uniref:Papilin-like n=1 Tax=Drosophila madeirensis TaxID=30013 RepID=A0AAU9FFE8_DROMD